MNPPGIDLTVRGIVIGVGMPEGRGGQLRCALAVSALAVAALASGCAALSGGRPSGDFSFDIGTQAASHDASWSIDDLPSQGSIRLEGYITPRAQIGLAASMRVNIGETRNGLQLAQIRFIDPECEGAYAFAIEHRAESDQSLVDYFPHKLPWEKRLKMRIDWSRDRRLSVSVDGVGQVEQTLQSRFERISFEASAGTLHVEKLEFLNLSPH